MQRTHLQALFVYADHHLLVQTLHAEPNVQNGPLIIQVFILPGPVRANGQGMETRGQGWREWKGQTGVPRRRSVFWLGTRVAQDGQIRERSALQTIHHIWKSHGLMRLIYRRLRDHNIPFPCITWFSQSDIKVVCHRSVGVGCNGTVAVFLRPLYQGLWS